MKKLLLLPLLFIVFACSTDEIEVGNTIDPFIGTWDLEPVGGCAEDNYRITINLMELGIVLMKFQGIG